MSVESLHRTISSGLVAASRQWRRICQNTLVTYGISEACAGPLLAIARLGDGAHQVKVAQAAGMESPTLVRLLDQLCQADIVCRTEDPNDRRAKALSLTRKGRALACSIEAELTRLRAEVLQGLQPADLEATLRVLQAFADAAQREHGGQA
ncbi:MULTISPECIES: MarR family winged helix-turn-helix transcriptional regulator [Pseudomonas]|jgi:MarR family transcriptional regulator for hemolysin|uniref:Regulatory protein, MarR n=6 Tax=Pseudomonas syringae group TaxID=136849 RepID=F3G9R1_PSESJ|nr:MULTISPECIES: MarR family transcriptional regulator [Pseudomonas]EGH43811.1 regulatory protein, MarR [Pseudomonas syringae pv. pisi str. 1704B]KEZ66616.1 MarR family transcriptional regulator [Pseudomonas syringae pv. syringae FF5]AKF50726.1 Transcriptional regulators [Pseudomonas syringae pv. syringae HS191]ELP95707.1 regulatory protein, MarR [Pseudomonas syringae BRIP34876]ELQ05718.1 regulatory protein, MarR [Pseudomonas syringae BRIP34881]